MGYAPCQSELCHLACSVVKGFAFSRLPTDGAFLLLGVYVWGPHTIDPTTERSSPDPLVHHLQREVRAALVMVKGVYEQITLFSEEPIRLQMHA